MQKIKSKAFLLELRRYVGITKYGSGMQCCALTRSVIESKASQKHLASWYAAKSSNNPNKKPAETNKEYLLRVAASGLYGADCCGLVKGIGYGNRVGGPTAKYIGADDITIKAMADGCTDKKKDVTLCEAGEFIWTADFGHCAVVSAKGKKDIESAPSLDGVKEVDLSYQGGGKINWAGGGKLPWVDYSDIDEEKPEQSSGTSTEKKSVEEVAKEVIAGRWGVMPDRQKRLEAAGYNYREVQDVVNAMCNGTYKHEWKTGEACLCDGTPIYSSSDSKTIAARRTGKHYIWSGEVVRGRIRITNKPEYVNVKPWVVGWADVDKLKQY